MHNIEFSCAAESLGPDGSMEQSSVFRTESKASAATICYAFPISRDTSPLSPIVQFRAASI